MIAAHANHLTLQGFRPATVRVRTVVLTAFARELEPRTLLETTRSDIEAFLARPMALESRRAYRNHIVGYFGWAVDEGLIPDDPTAKIPPVRVPRGLPRPIRAEELARAIDEARPQMRAWLALMSLGGLRALEVAGLRPDDLLETPDGTLLYLRECKGGGSATVPAHDYILTCLKALPIRDGQWWTCCPNWVSRSVSLFLRSTGSTATGHRLRHYAGTVWYRESGHDLLVTAQLLRHKNVSTTQVYAQLDPTRPAAVVRAVVLPSAS